MCIRQWFVYTICSLGMLAIPAASSAGVFVSINIAPPVLPVYVQPPVPGDGYIWMPGYWAYGDEGYYWVPGTWVLAPRVGVLWTPPWWGWSGGYYVFHAGYWGPHVGFYGGVNYGFGYTGVGFAGGAWNGGFFSYNRAVTNVNVTVVHNVYNQTVVNNTTVNRVSFNGGPGGTNARPMPSEIAAEREQHISPTGVQTQHEHAASINRTQFASVNHGRPSTAASPRAGEFGGTVARPAAAERPAARSVEARQEVRQQTRAGSRTASASGGPSARSSAGEARACA